MSKPHSSPEVMSVSVDGDSKHDVWQRERTEFRHKESGAPLNSRNTLSLRGAPVPAEGPDEEWAAPVTVKMAESPDDSETISVEAETSLQKLALLAGIKIDRDWTVNLAEAIGVEPWKISLAVLNKRIDTEMVKIIEAHGYLMHRWMVEKKSVRPMKSMVTGLGTNAELVRMVEEILHSGTIHATSLAMNIISMKAALDANHAGGPVKGFVQSIIWKE